MSEVSVNDETWTRDKDGNFVDWTKPPYYDEKTGRLNLLFEGEDYRQDGMPATLMKRVAEYTRLRAREIQRAKRDRNTFEPPVSE